MNCTCSNDNICVTFESTHFYSYGIVVCASLLVGFGLGWISQAKSRKQPSGTSALLGTEKQVSYTKDRKEASTYTQTVNRAVLTKLPFEDRSDFDRATRGFIAREKELVIRDKQQNLAWNMPEFSFLYENDQHQHKHKHKHKPQPNGENEEKAVNANGNKDDTDTHTRTVFDTSTFPPPPDSVNPSLWRNNQLLTLHGLYRVVGDIYQVRGYDVSVMTIIIGQSGYIVVDPLISSECAAAAMKLVYRELGIKKVVAVLYTHPHMDHWGGVEGVISQEQVNSGEVKIYAPEGFVEHVFPENIMLEQSNARRAGYQFGNRVPRDTKGNIGSGLGLTASNGTITFLFPTDLIPGPKATRIIDGITFQFLDCPGAEAPVEFMFYIPRWKALCVAEEANATMHNLYTLRGAEIRCGNVWAHWLTVALDMFGGGDDTPDDGFEVVYGSHYWPRFGREECREYLRKQRDLYKYIHDQTLRLANAGYNGCEIANLLELPDSLSKEFYNGEYYGTLKHNAQGQYQKYVGWFDGNPANLDPLPPEETSKRMVAMMGGAKTVLIKAKQAFDRGEYRWVAQLVNYVVFDSPKHAPARYLQADALEQLGYQSESGIWRNFYLSGVEELRHGIDTKVKLAKANAKIGEESMTPELIFQKLAVKVNGPKAAKTADILINFKFTNDNIETNASTKEANQTFPDLYLLSIQNGVLMAYHNKQSEDAQATVHVSQRNLVRILLFKIDVWTFLKGDMIKVEGSSMALVKLLSVLEAPNRLFNIVTP